jgi:hypothetical protein
MSIRTSGPAAGTGAVPRADRQRGVEGPSDLHNYRTGTKFYRRILGEAAPRESFTGRDSKWMGSKKPRPGIQDDQSENRVQGHGR